MSELTCRGAAVRTVTALRAMQRRCEQLQADWADLDYIMQAELGYLVDKLTAIRVEVISVYPGRKAPPLIDPDTTGCPS